MICEYVKCIYNNILYKQNQTCLKFVLKHIRLIYTTWQFRDWLNVISHYCSQLRYKGFGIAHHCIIDAIYVLIFKRFISRAIKTRTRSANNVCVFNITHYVNRLKDELYVQRYTHEMHYSTTLPISLHEQTNSGSKGDQPDNRSLRWLVSRKRCCLIFF